MHGLETITRMNEKASLRGRVQIWDDEYKVLRDRTTGNICAARVFANRDQAKEYCRASGGRLAAECE